MLVTWLLNYFYFVMFSFIVFTLFYRFICLLVTAVFMGVF